MVNYLSLDRIEEASRVVDPVFLRTPQYSDGVLNRHLDRRVVVKVETVNPLRSFKGRGADYYLRDVPEGVEVICASAGNFGQALAYAARTHRARVHVFAATTANPSKVARMRDLGAQVTLCGNDFDDAKDNARRYADAGSGRVFVEDGHDPRIAEGAGTIGVELAPLRLDAVVVPVGNGALISGVGRWLKEHSPRTRIIGVCAAGAPSMERSWRQGRPILSPTVSTSADGLAVRVPVPTAVAWMRKYVDDVVLVDEDRIRQALRIARDTLGLLLEPAGAAGIAALLQHNIEASTVATIITGSNASPDLFARLEHTTSP